MSGFGVTRLNPDLSKHLETATIQVKGLEIDIVNLRSEKYAHDTRIPTIVNSYHIFRKLERPRKTQKEEI